jgi:hypothetical protein
MSKLILSVMLLCVVSNAFAKDFWACDSLGKYSCQPNQQTCCRSRNSPTGWSCFALQEGVCCSDGISVCPKATTCNLKERRCDRTALTFLEENVSENSVEVFLEPKLISTPVELADGFLKGFGFFYDLPSVKDCKPNDPQITQDVLDIVNILKSIDIHSNFPQIIQDIFSKGKDAYDRISKVSKECGELADEAKQLFEKLEKHVSGYTYYAKLALHTTTNISQISEKVKSGMAAYDAGKFEDTGFAFGDLTKFTFFWNFQPDVTVMLEEIEEAINPNDLLKFALGANQGFSFFYNLPYQSECVVYNPRVLQIAEEVINIFKGLNIKNALNIAKQVVQKGREAIKIISSQGGQCVNYAAELTKVADRLIKRIDSKPFLKDVTYHALMNMNVITENALKVVDTFIKKDFSNSGIVGGSLIRFIFFWNM